MRQVLAIGAAAALAALGAVVLGEYPLQGVTVVVGFPLYGIAVTELALAIGRRLAPLSVLVVTALVAAGLTWALWISFGHFRNDARPPPLTWVMVAVAVVAALAWGRAGRRGAARAARPEAPAPAVGAGEGTDPRRASPSAPGRPGPVDEEVHP